MLAAALPYISYFSRRILHRIAESWLSASISIGILYYLGGYTSVFHLLNKLHILLGLLPNAHLCFIVLLLQTRKSFKKLKFDSTLDITISLLWMMIMYLFAYIQVEIQSLVRLLFDANIVLTTNMSTAVITVLGAFAAQARLHIKGKSALNTDDGRKWIADQLGMYANVKYWLLEFAFHFLIIYTVFMSGLMGYFFVSIWNLVRGWGIFLVLTTSILGCLIVLFMLDWQSWLVRLTKLETPDYAFWTTNEYLLKSWDTWDNMAGYVSGEKTSPESTDLDALRKTYVYKPLEKNHFRLLKLHRWNPRTRVTCSLVHTSLDGPIEYEAISYRWSESTEKLDILIDNQLFKVTPKVWNILQEQSSSRHSKMLWIDSICINQQDKVERSVQVKHMGQIYRRAKRVNMCLSEAAWSRVLVVWLTALILLRSVLSSERFFLWFGDVFKEAGAWKAIRQLLSEEYFSRVWIVQEVALAQKIQVRTGPYTIPWECVASIFHLIGVGGPQTEQAMRYLGYSDDNENFRVHLEKSREFINARTMMVSQLAVRNNQKIKLNLIVRMCWSYMATDPRDKIYALLGLADVNLSDPLLNVSYEPNNTPQAVFRNAAKYIYIREQETMPLNHSGIGFRRNLSNLPSWAPDWTGHRQNRWHGDEDSVNASRDLPPRISSGPDKDSIIVHGFEVDRIKCVGARFTGKGSNAQPTRQDSLSQPQGSIELHKENLNRWCSMQEWLTEANDMVLDRLPEPYPTGESRKMALWTCVTAKESKIEGETEYYPGVWDDMMLGLKFMQESEKHTSKETFPYHKIGVKLTKDGEVDPVTWDIFQNKMLRSVFELSHNIVDSSFCVTERGYMGIVPGGTAVGDSLVIAFGATSPCVFRLCKGCDQIAAPHPCYHHIGVGFIHGMMKGEMLDKINGVQAFTLY